MTDWGRLFVVVLNVGDEAPAQFPNYLPSRERTGNDAEFWLIIILNEADKQHLSSLGSPCSAEMEGRMSRCPGDTGDAWGVQCWGLPVVHHWVPPPSPDLLSAPGSVHKRNLGSPKFKRQNLIPRQEKKPGQNSKAPTRDFQMSRNSVLQAANLTASCYLLLVWFTLSFSI